MQELLELDYIVFEFIHSGLKNVFFDWIMPILRNKWIWTPFYLFVILLAFFNYSIKRATLFLVPLVITVILADFISAQIVKKSVERERPCQQIILKDQVIPLVKCGSGYSFPSSHAANHFAIAFFLIFKFRNLRKYQKVALLLWAGLISFAQIYVGVHFPLDVCGGIIVGYLVAKGIFFASERFISRT
jgi:undecaprenyl-diphosphatase